MKLVIDIPEEDFERCKKRFQMRINIMGDAIANGTILPKGHGRLGDLSKVYVKLNEAQIEGTEEYRGIGEAKQIVCDAATIIEADTTESENKESN